MPCYPSMFSKAPDTSFNVCIEKPDWPLAYSRQGFFLMILIIGFSISLFMTLSRKLLSVFQGLFSQDFIGITQCAWLEVSVWWYRCVFGSARAFVRRLWLMDRKQLEMTDGGVCYTTDWGNPPQASTSLVLKPCSSNSPSLIHTHISETMLDSTLSSFI